MLKISRKFLIISTFLIVWFYTADVVKACSCGPSFKTVKTVYEETPNIVLLKVKSIEKYDEKEIEEGVGYGDYGIKQSILVVEKVFKGNLKVGQELTFAQGQCCICGWTFNENSVGKEFLFYLPEKPGEDNRWYVSICSRSRLIENASADLLYLEKVSKVKGKTRLSGSLYKSIENPNNEFRYSFENIANHRLWITGKGKNIELITDENGVYEVYDLLPGKYTITPEKIDGFTFWNFPSVEVEIKPKGQIEKNISFELNNEISGKVIDKNGNPLKNVCLDLIPSRSENPYNYSKASCTGEKGQFQITAIPFGTYFLVINKDDEIRIYEPFKRFYYPNVKNKEQATEITIRENTFLKDIEIIPPEIIETITVSGTLRFKDGKPFADQLVKFIAEKDLFRTFDGKVGSDYEERTDKNGKFSFTIWKGQKGILQSSIFSFAGKYKKCPELEAIVKQKGGDSVQKIDTIAVNIDTTEDVSEINLRFPFPKCNEMEKD